MKKNSFVGKVFITESSRETQKIGKEFVTRLHLCQGVTLPKKCACVIALYGDLGSGKTTFVQGLGEGLGIKKRIVSPTFIIVRSYEVNIKYQILSIKYFYHIDLYRVDDKKGVEGLGVEDIINNPENIVAIEWAEKMGDSLPKRRIDIKFSYVDKEKRKIDVCTPNIIIQQTL